MKFEEPETGHLHKWTIIANLRGRRRGAGTQVQPSNTMWTRYLNNDSSDSGRLTS